MAIVQDYKTGDRVIHPSGAKGRVMRVGMNAALGRETLEVEWEPSPDNRGKRRTWRGEYCDLWLSQHALRKQE